MQLHKLLDKRETQPRSAVLPRRGRVCLHKGLEQFFGSLRRDPDSGVSYRNLRHSLFAPPVNRDRPAIRCKLDCVAQKVVNNLFELAHVPVDRGEFGFDCDSYPDLLLFGNRQNQDLCTIKHRLNIEINILQFHLPCLNLREIEYVIDKLQQVLAAYEDVCCVFRLLLIESTECLIMQDL